jgi:hypothetical protein
MIKGGRQTYRYADILIARNQFVQEARHNAGRQELYM